MSAPNAAGAQRVFPGAYAGAELVPGIPRRVADLAEQLEDVARGLAVSARLLNAPAPSSWHGAAATALARLLRSAPQPCALAAQVIGSAAQAVRAHAAVLAAAQREAEEAIALDLRAIAVARTAVPSSAATGPPPVVTAMQCRAVVVVELARARVRASAAAAAASLRVAADAAPEQPNALVRLGRGLVELQREVQLGAAESTLTMATALAPYGLQRLLADPKGWGAQVADLGAAWRQAVEHPQQTALAVLDWDNLVNNPGRFVGHLAPDVVAGFATGGAALVANRGVSAGVRVAAVAGPAPARAQVQAAISTARVTTRSRLRAVDLRPYAAAPNDFGHVTRLTPAQHLAAAALARDARWAERDLTGRVTALARSIAVTPDGLPQAVKGRESLLRKVSEQLARPAPLAAVVPGVNDTVRYTLVARPGQYVAKAGEAITALSAAGMTLTQAKNFWTSDRYRGLNLTVADARTGRLVEVQLHTPESFLATKDTHRDYERFRQQGISAPEQELLRARIRAVFDAVPEPAGIAGLDNALSRYPTTPAGNTPPQLLSPHPWAVPGATAGAVVLSQDDSYRAERGAR